MGTTRLGPYPSENPVPNTTIHQSDIPALKITAKPMLSHRTEASARVRNKQSESVKIKHQRAILRSRTGAQPTDHCIVLSLVLDLHTTQRGRERSGARRVGGARACVEEGAARDPSGAELAVR